MAEERVDYIMILNIQKITRVTSRTGNTYNGPTKEEEKKTETEVVKLVIRDKNLDKLVERGIKHLQLTTDEDDANNS